VYAVPEMRAVWVVRCAMLALSATLAIVLIERGNVLIGGLIGALVVSRAVLFVSMTRRRREFRQRFHDRIGNRTTGF
jgi:hypothetical protein